jgi:hypothetical protein
MFPKSAAAVSCLKIALAMASQGTNVNNQHQACYNSSQEGKIMLFHRFQGETVQRRLRKCLNPH